ncbi:unnamed protein product [Urochloa humidicola]
METQTSIGAYPPWVLLQQFGMRMNKVEDPSSSKDYAHTLVSGCTSAGETIQVCLRLAEPPEPSAVLYSEPPEHHYPDYIILAAHRDSLLIQARDRGTDTRRATVDHFVYNAGNAAADPPRLPSLSLLPPSYPADQEGIRWSSCSWDDMSRDLEYFADEEEIRWSFWDIGRYLDRKATGMLRHGKDEVVVAELQMVAASHDTPETYVAELFLFRSGEWSVKHPKISYGSRDFCELPSLWTTNTVIPVSDRQLCWVDLCCGVLFCDVFDEIPKMKFLPLPRDPCYGQDSNRNVCVTDGGSALKFVNIFPRCCCGSDGNVGCHRSLGAYTINTWTMRMSDMEWVKDGIVDATEIWGLDDYKSLNLPRIMPTYPVVSMVEPYTICFLLTRALYDQDGFTRDGDKDLWLIMVNMKSKTLSMVTQYSGGCRYIPTLIPSNVSYYFNYYPSSCSDDGMSTGQSRIESPPNLRDNDANNTAMQSSCQTSAEPAVEAAEILAAHQELPSYGLDRDDLLKAYRILSQGDGHRFRSLSMLPKNLRKDWLLMEIKASET